MQGWGKLPGKNKRGRWAPPPGWSSTCVGEGVVAGTGCKRSSQGGQGKSCSTVNRKVRNNLLGHGKLVILLLCRNKNGGMEWLLSSKLSWLCSLPELCKYQTINRLFPGTGCEPSANAWGTYVGALWGLHEAKFYKPCHQQATWPGSHLVPLDAGSPTMCVSGPRSFCCGRTL